MLPPNLVSPKGFIKTLFNKRVYVNNLIIIIIIII